MRQTLLTAVLLLANGTHLSGQSHDHPVDAWIEDVSIGMANAFTGGVTAAVRAWLGDHDVGRAFAGGMLGGATVFAGKRIAAEGFGGAGLIGREVGAVGSSMVRNAAAGESWLREVWLPVGPIWLQASPASSHGLRLNGWDVAELAWASTRPELELDWGATASSGAFVFNAPGHQIRQAGDPIDGFASAGVIVLGPNDTDEVRLVRGHEIVHVIQNDFALQNWGRPVESWGWHKILGRDVPVDLGFPFLLMEKALFRALYEAEAGTLEARCGC